MAATATLANKTVKVTPGSEATLEVRIRNSGTIVDQFTLEVLGDSAAWALVEPAVIPLFPGAEGVARVKFKPPKSSSVPAKAIPFAIRVKSSEDARASLVEEGVVEVGPFLDTFAELIPRTAKGSSRARAQLALDNRGNTRVNARLTAVDPDRKLNFTINPPALSAEPGTASFASIRLAPRQRFLLGPPKLNPYKVMVHQDGLPTITVDGSMQQVGLVPSWLLPVVIGAIALLLLLGILWFTVIRQALVSTAQQAAANSAAVQNANANASQALAKANQALGKQPSPTPGAQILGPNGGPAYSNILGPLPSQGTSQDFQIVVTPNGNLIVTDLVFENPDGQAGTLYLKRGNTVLFSLKLENFRDYDLHFLTPQVFQAKDTMTLSCQNATPNCGNVQVYYSGYYLNPPS